MKVQAVKLIHIDLVECPDLGCSVEYDVLFLACDQVQQPCHLDDERLAVGRDDNPVGAVAGHRAVDPSHHLSAFEYVEGDVLRAQTVIPHLAGHAGGVTAGSSPFL